MSEGARKKDSEILFELVRERYGGRLSADELEEVRKAVDVIAENAEALRRVGLENWDEPSSVFRPFRGRR
jgi:predicted nucleotidyltransferase